MKHQFETYIFEYNKSLNIGRVGRMYQDFATSTNCASYYTRKFRGHRGPFIYDLTTCLDSFSHRHKTDTYFTIGRDGAIRVL